MIPDGSIKPSSRKRTVIHRAFGLKDTYLLNIVIKFYRIPIQKSA